nr:MAG TPA_asm: hypothetical protein [Caudoviricetes sp.]
MYELKKTFGLLKVTYITGKRFVNVIECSWD